MTTRDNGDWIKTIIGAVTSVVVSLGGVYTVVIVPLQNRMDKMEAARADDGKRLVDLYLSIQTNNEYKIFAQAERDGLRRDLSKIEAHVMRVENEQRARASSVTSIGSLEKRLDRLTQDHNEMERRFVGTYNIGDEVKSLRTALESLRQRIMIPIGSNGKD